MPFAIGDTYFLYKWLSWNKNIKLSWGDFALVFRGKGVWHAIMYPICDV